MSDIDPERRAISTLPLSARTAGSNTNSPSFHVIKVPPVADSVDRLQRVVVEYCIQPLGTATRQAVWWTSYVVVTRPGTLTRLSGVYTEWNEFGTLSSQAPVGIIAPRTSGISIAGIDKGVLNGNQTNGTVLQIVDLRGTSSKAEIYAVLVASGMHDGAYQVHGQASLEYKVW